jgi:Type II secretion system (T2SS), protein E, N-terminal domain
MRVDQTVETAARAVEEHPRGGPMHDVPLGTLVLRAGLLPQAQIESALHDAVHSGRRLGEVLVERGLAERDLARLLAAQNAQPFVDLLSFPVDYELARLLPASVAQMYCALPFADVDGTLLVAVPDPEDDGQRERLRGALGRPIRLVAAARSEIKDGIGGLPERRPAESKPQTYEVVVTLADGRVVVIDRLTVRENAEALAERVADDAVDATRIETRDGVVDGAEVVSVEVLQRGTRA